MSAMLIILLSGLSLFGAVIIDPVEVSEEPEATPEPEPSVEGGTSPLSEAMADPEASEDEVLDGTSPDDEDEVETETEDGDSTITGSAQSDTIDGAEGDDVIDGRLGDDTIEGGTGADSVSGGLGDDILYGGSIDGPDDGASDTLDGGEGNDQIHLGNTDTATGGEGEDTFIRLSTMTSRALVTDFDASEDMIVIEHEDDAPPTVVTQTIASDGVIIALSDESQIELAGLTEAVDASLISFVDTRAT